MFTTLVILLTANLVFVFLQRLFNHLDWLVKVAGSLVIAMMVLGWLFFAGYALSDSLFSHPWLLLAELAVINLLVFALMQHKHDVAFHLPTVLLKRHYAFELGLLLVLFLFSAWLMFGSAGYDQHQHAFKIGSHVWGDFASHIPTMRSFSYTHNFPPQYPLFPFENMRYHFLFYFLAAIFEKMGDNLLLSLNILSTLSFWAMLLLIYATAKNIFKARSIGLLSLGLVLSNSSLTFVKYFASHALFSAASYIGIVRLNKFVSIGPYDGGIIAIFWNLNNFTNQRHLALGFGVCLFSFLIFYTYSMQAQRRKVGYLLIGILVGLLPFMHAQVFLMTMLVLGVTAFLHLQRPIFSSVLLMFGIAIALALPQLLWLQNILPFFTTSINSCSTTCSGITKAMFAPGFILPHPITFLSFLGWWLQNIGVVLILLPLALLIVPKSTKKLYLAFFSLFLLGYLFQFGPIVTTNHKFFNLWLLFSNMYIAAFLWWLFKKQWYGKVVFGLLLLPLTFSGIIDFFPIVNNEKIVINDWQHNELATFVLDHTPQDTTFLTSNMLYHPVSLTGRKVFLGWQIYAFSAGSDTVAREKIVTRIYQAQTKAEACQLLQTNHLDYLTLENDKGPLYWQNKPFFDNYFKVILETGTEQARYVLYDVKKSCETFSSAG